MGLSFGCFDEGPDPEVPSDGTFTGGSFTGGSTGGPGTDASPFISGGLYTKPVVVAASPPRAVSGGTLAVIDGGRKAAVADSDRDQVSIVDLDLLTVTTTIALEKGDEPGRLVEDGTRRVHVVLRGAEGLADLDPATGTVLGRRHVCPHPRGLAYDAAADALHVACAGGELVSMPASGGDATRRLVLDRDLRDVVVDGGRLLVSRFRAAELLVVEADGTVSQRLKPPPSPSSVEPPGVESFSPAVAWRTIAAPGGGALMALQEERLFPIKPSPTGAYGGGKDGCDRIVKSTISLFRLDGAGSVSMSTSENVNVVLPVDVATTLDGSNTAVAGAAVTGVPSVLTSNAATVVEVVIPPPPPVPDAGSPPIGPCPTQSGRPSSYAPSGAEQAVAVAFDRAGQLLIQTREPALLVNGRRIVLPGSRIEDTGYELFHLATFAGLACASCHPEGREDGHVWTFSLGPRRTQTLGGGILGTEPFHWNGEMANFSSLAHDVFNGRMTGPDLSPAHMTAFANWINAIPAWKPTAPADGAAAERGRVLFNDPTVGCSGCHSGAKMTNNTTVDVGTRALFQVPSLRGVGFRAPFMHDGCAATFRDRFGSCGGGDKHGVTSTLSDGQRADLVAYLETL
jgi:hypothetical protein